jgi:hypothetical protein
MSDTWCVFRIAYSVIAIRDLPFAIRNTLYAIRQSLINRQVTLCYVTLQSRHALFD